MRMTRKEDIDDPMEYIKNVFEGKIIKDIREVERFGKHWVQLSCSDNVKETKLLFNSTKDFYVSEKKEEQIRCERR